MKHAWIVQNASIENTDQIFAFTSQSKALKFIKENGGLDVWYFIGKTPVH